MAGHMPTDSYRHSTAGFRVVGHLAFPKRYTSAQKYLRYQHECAYLLAKGCPKEPQYTIGDAAILILSFCRPLEERAMQRNS